MINKFIFREYDIRGVVKEDFPEHVVVKIGKAFGTYVKRHGGNEIVISGDIRDTTLDLMNYLKTGILSTGIDVINLGKVPTPVNYFSMFHLGISGAIQVTGSHNPPEFNGFKLSLEKKPFFGKQIQSLYNIIRKMDFEEGDGTEARFNILDHYSNMIQEKISIERPMKVVMDCGNATGCINAPTIFKSLGIELKQIHCVQDPTFPNHHPDPTVKENLNDLIRQMEKGVYDVGIAFDGDADRIGVVDDKGEILWSDQLMCIFLPEVVSQGDSIVFDVKCSQALEDVIKKLKGEPIMCKTGHSHVKQKMKDINCKFGGEMSGHIFFADDYYGYDDAIYVAARLVQLLSKSRKPLSQLRSSIPRYYSTPEIRLEADSDKDKFNIANKAVEYFKKKYECKTVDGVRIMFQDGWGLVRASNTQPVIVCRFEALSLERRDEIKSTVLEKLFTFGNLNLELN